MPVRAAGARSHVQKHETGKVKFEQAFQYKPAYLKAPKWTNTSASNQSA